MTLREAVRFLRWRTIALRYAGKFGRTLASFPLSEPVARLPQTLDLQEQGWAVGPRLNGADLSRIRGLYLPRAKEVVPSESGHPFTNLFRTGDIEPDNPLCRFAFSRDILDVAHDYFGGRPRYNSIQLMYSWPTGGSLQESQLWHRDYGDSKSLHCITYLNDLLDEKDGPFVFVDRKDTRRIKKRPIIRRIPDERFLRELGGGTVRAFYGKAGETLFVDPAVCYHYGSRCKEPRFAVMVTFSTDRPYVAQTNYIKANRSRLLETALAVRRDLAEGYLRAVLSADKG